MSDNRIAFAADRRLDWALGISGAVLSGTWLRHGVWTSRFVTFTPGQLVIDLMVIVAGVFLAWHFFRRAKEPRPRLIVGEQVIEERTSMFLGERTISWEEVANVERVDRMRVSIVLKDLDGFLERSRFLQANALRVRRLLGRPPIVLRLDQLRIKPGEVQGLLQTRLDQMALDEIRRP